MKTKKVFQIILIYIFTVLFLKFFLIIPTRWLIYLLAPFWITLLIFIAYLIIMFAIVYVLNLIDNYKIKRNEKK
jgi:hypothetical protein